MNPDSQVALVGAIILIGWTAFHVIRVWREQNEFERGEVLRRKDARIEFLEGQRAHFVDVCAELSGQLREADRLAEERLLVIGSLLDNDRDALVALLPTSNVVPLRGAK